MTTRRWTDDGTTWFAISGVGPELAAPAEHVLDLATGTGNVALAAARRGASVIGVDSAARLLEVARSRATAEGLCPWRPAITTTHFNGIA